MPVNRQDPNFLSNINLFKNATGVPSFSSRRQDYLDAQAASEAPSKASAAPVAGEQNIFAGLCDALNKYQKELVKLKKREIPDQYVIEFAPASVGASTVKRPGPQDATTAPMQNPNTAKKIDPTENNLNRNAQTWPIAAGTQIIKVIDDVMRNSSYITDQQNVEITTATDPVTGVQTQKINAKAGTGDFKWYKISVSAKQLGLDKIIHDQAYRMTFIITPYPVAQMTSQYFPDSRYKGVHKAYQYWFTGANTQILSYEQNYNNAYRILLSGIGADAQKTSTTDFRDQNRYIYQATSPNQSTGAKNYANEPGNNAASFLYDPSSFGTVRMRIIGDPAWMQQGEAGLGVSAKTFDFSPFGADGSINFDSQAVMFSVAFNTPSDYDFNTGLVNVNKNTRNGQPQEYYTFQAVTVKNYFSKGRFEQELTGKLIIGNKAQADNAGRSIAGSTSTADPTTTTNVRTNAISQSQADAQDLENGANAGTGTSSTQDSIVEQLPAKPQPASPPGATTSSGDITAADIAAIEANRNVPVAPQNASEATAAIAAGSGYVPTQLTSEQQQIQALGARLNQPQNMDKET